MASSPFESVLAGILDGLAGSFEFLNDKDRREVERIARMRGAAKDAASIRSSDASIRASDAARERSEFGLGVEQRADARLEDRLAGRFDLESASAAIGTPQEDLAINSDFARESSDFLRELEGEEAAGADFQEQTGLSPNAVSRSINVGGFDALSDSPRTGLGSKVTDLLKSSNEGRRIPGLGDVAGPLFGPNVVDSLQVDEYEEAERRRLGGFARTAEQLRTERSQAETLQAEKIKTEQSSRRGTDARTALATQEYDHLVAMNPLVEQRQRSAVAADDRKATLDSLDVAYKQIQNDIADIDLQGRKTALSDDTKLRRAGLDDESRRIDRSANVAGIVEKAKAYWESVGMSTEEMAIELEALRTGYAETGTFTFSPVDATGRYLDSLVAKHARNEPMSLEEKAMVLAGMHVPEDKVSLYKRASIRLEETAIEQGWTADKLKEADDLLLSDISGIKFKRTPEEVESIARQFAGEMAGDDPVRHAQILNTMRVHMNEYITTAAGKNDIVKSLHLASLREGAMQARAAAQLARDQGQAQAALDNDSRAARWENEYRQMTATEDEALVWTRLGRSISAARGLNDLASTQNADEIERNASDEDALLQGMLQNREMVGYVREGGGKYGLSLSPSFTTAMEDPTKRAEFLTYLTDTGIRLLPPRSVGGPSTSKAVIRGFLYRSAGFDLERDMALIEGALGYELSEGPAATGLESAVQSAVQGVSSAGGLSPGLPGDGMGADPATTPGPLGEVIKYPLDTQEQAESAARAIESAVSMDGPSGKVQIMGVLNNLDWDSFSRYAGTLEPVIEQTLSVLKSPGKNQRFSSTDMRQVRGAQLKQQEFRAQMAQVGGPGQMGQGPVGAVAPPIPQPPQALPAPLPQPPVEQPGAASPVPQVEPQQQPVPPTQTTPLGRAQMEAQQLMSILQQRNQVKFFRDSPVAPDRKKAMLIEIFGSGVSGATLDALLIALSSPQFG